MIGECEKRERMQWKARRRRRLHRVSGLCLECNRVVVSGRSCCSIHLAKARAKSKQEYDWRVANGVCVKCGTPKEEGRTAVNCVACAAKAAASERNRRMTNDAVARYRGEHGLRVGVSSSGGRRDRQQVA